jgi:hypothetical protein
MRELTRVSTLVDIDVHMRTLVRRHMCAERKDGVEGGEGRGEATITVTL